MSKIAEFRLALRDVPAEHDAGALRIRSRDFFWLSPILRHELEHCCADLVVRPRNRDDLIRISSAAARFGLPVTVRGGGTGYRGESVPLNDGVIVDMTGLVTVTLRDDDHVVAQAGARFLEIDRALSSQGREIRLHSVARKAGTIGGFIAGAKRGCGEAFWGGLERAGILKSLEVVTVEDTPRVLTLTGQEMALMVGARGITGFIHSVELDTVPARGWSERIFEFPDLARAVAFGREMIGDRAPAAKLVSVFDPSVTPLLDGPARLITNGCAAAMVMVLESEAEEAEILADSMGGSVVYGRAASEADEAIFRGIGAIRPLYEYAWQQTALHVARREPALTHLQFDMPLEDADRLVQELEDVFGEGMIHHFEFVRGAEGGMAVAFPLLRYAGHRRLAAIKARMRQMGLVVKDPHTVRFGGTGFSEIERFRESADPRGLLNQGKFFGSGDDPKERWDVSARDARPPYGRPPLHALAELARRRKALAG